MTTQLLKSRRIHDVVLPRRTQAASPLDEIAAAVRQLERAEEKTPATLEAIEVLDMLRRSAQAGRAQSEDFTAAHRALVRAGLEESGGLHSTLNRAEESLRSKRQPAAR